jgi:predicted TIM-barrel fold metal-dependent hydrolase
MIIDAHVHLCAEMGRLPWGVPHFYPSGTGEETVRILDAAGVDKATVFAAAWHGDVVDPTYQDGNDVVGRAGLDFPDRILPFGRVNPNFGRKAVEELERCVEQYGIRGIKLHPDWDIFVPADREIMFPIAEVAEKYGLILSFHCGQGDYYSNSQPTWFLDLAKSFPTVKIILLHMGFRLWHDAVSAARQRPNIYLETSSVSPGKVMLAIRGIGPERIIYGSDTPFVLPQEEIVKVRYMPGLSVEEKALILGDNLARLLEIA